DLDNAIAAFTDEAHQHADEVPRDSGLEGLTGIPAAPDSGMDAANVPAGDGAGSWRLAGDVSDDATDATAGDGEAPHDSGQAPTLAAPSAGDAGDAAADPDGFDYDPERFGRAGSADDAPQGIEEFLAAQASRTRAEEEQTGTAAVSGTEPATDPAADESTTRAPSSGLSLVEDDAAFASAPGRAQQTGP